MDYTKKWLMDYTKKIVARLDYLKEGETWNVKPISCILAGYILGDGLFCRGVHVRAIVLGTAVLSLDIM